MFLQPISEDALFGISDAQAATKMKQKIAGENRVTKIYEKQSQINEGYQIKCPQNVVINTSHILRRRYYSSPAGIVLY